MIEPKTDTYLFRINDELRKCPVDLWDSLVGPLPPHDFRCNGCTASPDFWLGIPVWIACRPHDWHYSDEGPEIHRLIADVTFRLNLWRVARYYKAPLHRAWYLAGTYSSAVIVVGKSHFKPGRKPPTEHAA